MKFAHYFFSALLLMIPACDDDDHEGEKKYVLKTITMTPPGLTYTVYYNERGQISGISNSDDGWTGTLFEYDNKGNLINGNNWYFYYDKLNRLCRIVAGERDDSLIYNSTDQLAAVIAKFDMGGTIKTTKYWYTYPNSTTKNFSKVEYDYGVVEEVEYDNTPNPFEHNWMQFGSANFLMWDRLCYQTDNNIKRITATSELNTMVCNYMYTYNEKNYPTSIIVETTVIASDGTSVVYSDPLTLTYDYL